MSYLQERVSILVDEAFTTSRYVETFCVLHCISQSTIVSKKHGKNLLKYYLDVPAGQ